MQLTNSSRQVLLSLVKSEINALEGHILNLKAANRYNYEHSDVAQPEETAYFFETLNEFRNIIRECKKRVKKLAQVSKELKAELRGVVYQEQTITLNLSDIVMITDKFDIK